MELTLSWSQQHLFCWLIYFHFLEKHTTYWPLHSIPVIHVQPQLCSPDATCPAITTAEKILEIIENFLDGACFSSTQYSGQYPPKIKKKKRWKQKLPLAYLEYDECHLDSELVILFPCEHQFLHWCDILTAAPFAIILHANAPVERSSDTEAAELLRCHYLQSVYAAARPLGSSGSCSPLL